MNPGHHNGQDVAAVTAGNPAAADCMRDIEGAVHHDIGHRIKAART
jgi:hypothetical protein